MTPEFLRASIDREIGKAERLLNLSLPTDWPDDPSILSLRLEQLESNPALQPWLLRAMRLRDTGEMVGHIGFHTAPGAPYLQDWAPAGVEFGFTVFSAYRRRGYAREASLALMQWACEVHGITEFLITVGRENMASTALAAALGFGKVGSHIDEVDGVEDVFIRSCADAGR